MNRIHFSFLLIPFLGILTLNAQDETPIIPVGSLSAFPTIVQAGTHPTLTWEVTIPETVDKVVTLDDTGSLVPNRDLVMDVLVIGTGVTTETGGANPTVVDVPVEIRTTYSGQGPVSVFYGTNDDVKPNKNVYSGPVSGGSIVDFSSRYHDPDGTWGPFYDSTVNSPNVVALQNGDIPPTSIPMLNNPTLEPYLLPYLDETGKIKLGARDVIILIEVTHTDQTSADWGLDDVALLVTFYDERTNNGHGNNTDGVDMSNPGASKEGEDSDPTVDDEQKVRGKRKK